MSFLKFLDRFLCFPGHEVAFAQGGVQVGALRRNLQAGFEQRNRIFKIILGHADASHQENHVRILRRQLMCAHQQIESIQTAWLVRNKPAPADKECRQNRASNFSARLTARSAFAYSCSRR